MDPVIDSALEHLEPGTRVRLKIDGGEVFEGALHELDVDDYVSLLNDAGGHTDVARELIVDIWEIIRTPAPE